MKPDSAPAEVHRRRVIDELRACREPVIVLGAPTGFGKSTAVRQWLDADERPCAWLSLTTGHDDPVVLATAVQDALATLAGVDPPLPRAYLTASQPTFSADVLPTLADLMRRPVNDGPRQVLVLDDVAGIDDSAAVEVLRTLAKAASPERQLVLISRGSTPSYLARVRASGRLATFGAEELAFDSTETAALYRLFGVDHRYAAEAAASAEGWAVVLYLAALHAVESGGPGLPPGPVGSDAFVIDFCRSEVLAGLDPPEQEFLLATSVLDVLTPELCDAVVGRTDSGVTLRHLHERFGLVRRIDDGAASHYRYHAILATAMRAELAARDSGAAARLLARAAAWHADRGQIDAAVDAAKQAGDIDRTANYIWSDIGQCLMSGRPDLLRRRLRGLTDREISSNIWLELAAAWLALQSADREALLRGSLRLERAFEPDLAAAAATNHAAAAVALLKGVQEGIARGPLHVTAALAGLPADSILRASAELVLGVYLSITGDDSEADSHLTRACELSVALHAPQPGAVALAWRSLWAMARDDWATAAAQADQAWRALQEHGLAEVGSSAMVFTARAVALAARHHPDADAALATARRVTTTMGGVLPWFGLASRYLLARAAALISDGATARVLVAEADALYAPIYEGTLIATLRDQSHRALGTLSSGALDGEALTDAELRVLAFLPSYLSRARIGQELFISTNTVKTHTSSIYRKLNVSSRSEAVARARELGLITSPYEGRLS